MFLFVNEEADQGWKETEDQRQWGSREKLDQDHQEI